MRIGSHRPKPEVQRKSLYVLNVLKSDLDITLTVH